MEKLLAAVAQTHGFDDDDSVQSAARMEHSGGAGGENGGLQWPAGVRPVVIFHNPPPAPISKARKRKRGRPPAVQTAAKPLPPPSPPPKRTKQEVEEEEDVCFICFDGGSLVLCDRKGCPKAYHPACIKRDEAFFNTKAKWTCGWHICSVCQKGSYYMCYTCTYSLCKGCIEDADFSCVRGNKGFCSTCMKTIMLIENKDQAIKDSVQVDFDDKTNWEYLFKVYWVILKEKLSLTMSELMKARKPLKGATDVGSMLQLSSVHGVLVNGNASTTTGNAKHLELSKPHVGISLQQNDGLKTEQSSESKEKDGSQFNKDNVKQNMDKVTDEPSTVKANDEPGIKEATDRPSIKDDLDKSSATKDTDKPRISKSMDPKELDRPGIDHRTEWATKELLEFVAHMRNGDASSVSQFDVQMLMLDYVKRNNLWDLHQKNQIICDERLNKLFLKPCVGHMEMLKFLESHFLGKDNPRSSFIPAAFVADSMEVDENMHDVPKQVNVRKRRGRKKKEKRPVQNHINDYAAIDVHNINLIYLRCNLMENLLKDPESFNNKVVGSIVRIRIFSDDGKQELYRLVRVVGTIKTVEPYKIGDRTSDIMLEILNLNKKEVVQICAISNQEFTEDECIRLRQSIKCGLVKPCTVGEVQKKAVELQPVIIDDWLVAELLRLKNLRDRASENGNQKEVREYVDKLQLLQSLEERQRRIAEVSEVHSDPRMSPYYESEEDSPNCISDRKGFSVGPKTKKGENMGPNNAGRPRKGRKSASPNKKFVSNEERRMTRAQSRMMEAASGSNDSDKQMNQVSNNASGSIGYDQAMQRLETTAATASAGNSPSANHIETENLWHYRDPNGRIQGPFSMMQLRRWNTTGLFSPDMRIWTNHEQYDSVLLTDALNGHFHGASEMSRQPSSVSQENGTGIGVSEVKNTTMSTITESNQTEAVPPNPSNVSSGNNTRPAREDVSGSSWWPPCWNFLKDDNDSCHDVQGHKMPPTSRCGQTDVVLPNRGPRNNVLNRGEQTSSGLTQNGKTSGNELQIQCNNEDRDSKSSKLKPLNIDWSLNDSERGDVLAPVSKLLDSSKPAGNTDVLDLPSTGPNFEPVSKPPKSDKQAGNIDVMDLLSTAPNFGTASKSHKSDKPAGNIDELDLCSTAPDFAPLSKSPDSYNKQVGSIDVLDLLRISPKTSENQQSIPSDVPIQNSCILELLDLTPKSNNEDHVGSATETKQSAVLNFPVPDSGPSWSSASITAVGGMELSDVAGEWNPDIAFPSSMKLPESSSENVATLTTDGFQVTHSSMSNPTSNALNWLSSLDEPIEFDAFGEESVSDLLAEVDALESHGASLPSPTSAMKFARELIEDCKDDCFSSIEDFSSASEPQKIDALSSSGEIQLTSQSSSAQCKPMQRFDVFNSIKRSSVNSSASSEGETNAPAYDARSEFHPPAPNTTNQDMFGGTMATVGGGSDTGDPGRGIVQGNINLVTVQGNVNLVLGGPSQGMGNIGWGTTNPGTAWANQKINNVPAAIGSLPWDSQRKYGGERFTSPRDCGGYQGNDSGLGRGRLPWGRQPFVSSIGGGSSSSSSSIVSGTGGYSRPNPKGQRICKFYESGRCKKGAFCHYLHHP